jgi:hypothetical protein
MERPRGPGRIPGPRGRPAGLNRLRRHAAVVRTDPMKEI